MKKLLFIPLIFLCTTTLASNEARIKELQKEAQEVADKRSAFIGEAQKMEVRLYELSGALKELMDQDKPKEKK